MTDENPEILFLGCGNMGAAIAAGILGNMPGASVTAVDPDPDRVRSLLPAEAPVLLHASLGEVGERVFDVVILGVKPQVFPALADRDLAWLSRQTVVSIMAGIDLARLSRHLGSTRVVRVMPNLPATVGEGMSLGCAVPGAIDKAQKQIVERIFASVGQFLWAEDETQFELANPVFSCGPGFLFAIAEQMIAAAEASGVPERTAEALVQQTFLGAARMLTEDSRSATELKRAVTSPNGTTQAGLGVLEAEGALPAIIPATFRAAHRRAQELARGA